MVNYNSEEYRKRLVEEYDNYFKTWPKKWGSMRRDEIVVDVLANLYPDPIDILDVGCGNGHLLQLLGVAFPDVKLYGLDISPEALKIAADAAPWINWIEGFIEDLPEKKKYSVVILQGTIEHFVDPSAALAKVKSILRKGGIVYVEAPNNLAYDPGEHTYRRLKRGSRQMEWHLSAEEWEAMFEAAGFEILLYRREDTPQWGNIWVLTPAQSEKEPVKSKKE